MTNSKNRTAKAKPGLQASRHQKSRGGKTASTWTTRRIARFLSLVGLLLKVSNLLEQIAHDASAWF